MLADHLKHNPSDIGLLRRIEERKGGTFPPRRDIPVYGDLVAEEGGAWTPADWCAVRCHQHFKGAFVAALPRESSWRVNSAELTEILKRIANHGIPSRFDRSDPVGES